MNGKEQLETLYQRYQDNQCSPEEFLQLLDLLSSENEQTRKEVLNLFEGTWNSLEVFPGQFNLPQTVVPTEEEEINHSRVVPIRRPWLKYIAAAAVLVLVAVGAWWFTSRDKQATVVAVAPKQQDLPPGREGAILTLADGRQVVLDSTQGKIAVDGGATITNKEGKLTYQEEKASAQAVVYNLMTTPRGRTYSLVLSDGTRVWLNASSSIRYPTAFTGGVRRVQVTGEAYFEVAHDASRPFRVGMISSAAGNQGQEAGEVEVLGTHFNINAYDDEDVLKVTLLEGSVKLSATATNLKNNAAILKPGEQGQLQTTGNQLQTVNDVDLDEVMAWKNGYFQFENASLQQVMRQVARWYDVDIVYQGQVPKREFVGTLNRSTSLSGVLKILEANRVNFTVKDRKIIIQP